MGMRRFFTEAFDLVSGDRIWAVLYDGPEAEIDDSIARQRRTDPDLWVLEVEDHAGRHHLDDGAFS